MQVAVLHLFPLLLGSMFKIQMDGGFMKFKKVVLDKFLLFTVLVSLVLGGLYTWKGVKTGFPPLGCIIIALNFLYVPFAFVFSRKGFPYFYLAYSAVLIFSMAFEQTYLYNNYTALFIVCVVIMIKPKLRLPAIIFYFVFVTVAFAVNEEILFHYFIHVVRSIWYIGIVEFVLIDKFKRKKLVLYEDERNILNQLCHGKMYQKEVEGFSENTIYRKLKAARERNGNITRDQLVEEYRKELEEEKSGSAGTEFDEAT